MTFRLFPGPSACRKPWTARALLAGLCVLLVLAAGSAPGDDLSALRRKAQGFSDAGRYELALPAWEEVVTKSQPVEGAKPSHVYLNGLIEAGISASLLGRPEPARAHLERAAALAPSDPRAILNLGLLHLRQRDLGRAEELFRRTIELDPAYPDAHFHLGLIAEERGDFALAKECYIKEVNIMGGTNRAWVRLFTLQKREHPQREASSPVPIILFSAACLMVGSLLLVYHRVRTIRKPARTPVSHP